MKLHIDPSERWIILGKTGSGKTIFVKHLLRIISQKMPVVIIDPNEIWLGKGKGGQAKDWAARKEKGTIDKPHLIDVFNPKWHVQCLQVDEDPTDERLARLCYEVIRRGNTFVYFDETSGIATANSVPKHITRLWKTGRAHNIGAWAATQAPTGIPKIFKSQAEKFISFKVGMEDTELVAALLHTEKAIVQELKNFEWLYYDTELDAAVWNPPIPYKEQKKA